MPAAAAVEAPTGLLYRPDLIDLDKEERLVDFVRDLAFREVSMRGQTARRRVRMRLMRRQTKDSCLSYVLALEPRSGYALDGSAHWAWQRSIPPAKALRYSIAFRTLRER